MDEVRHPQFDGFPAVGISFLKELESNNTKAWFDAHRATYDDAVLKPSIAFSAALGERLAHAVPGVVVEPRIGGSLFRIHRNLRFSRDKRPYKTHVGIRFRHETTATGPRCAGPVFYVQLDATSVGFGIGTREFSPASRQAYRAAVRDGTDADELAAELRGLAVSGYQPERDRRDGLELSKRSGLYVEAQMPAPDCLGAAGFVDICDERLTPGATFFQRLLTLTG